ncbi:hypothetical protein OPT61_g4571 [Boeremia exigua]|uniref:Uncharacterized protein n=1 Tax=Boeremia exigua TaxID=749465 RepID=A0ACC2IDF8_9PLEO|nr:hypothetical protein OPT61_g4571 [Boeremia exigua]
MRNRITHITKTEFLPCFISAHNAAITPKRVIIALDVKLRTPSPQLPTNNEPWQSQTPSNTLEFGSQSTLIREKYKKQQGSSPNSVLSALEHYAKGGAILSHKLVLAQQQIAELQAANEAATQRKLHKRKRVKAEGTLVAEDGLRLATLREFGARSDGKKAKKQVVLPCAAPVCGVLVYNRPLASADWPRLVSSPAMIGALIGAAELGAYVFSNPQHLALSPVALHTNHATFFHTSKTRAMESHPARQQYTLLPLSGDQTEIAPDREHASAREMVELEDIPLATEHASAVSLLRRDSSDSLLSVASSQKPATTRNPASSALPDGSWVERNVKRVDEAIKRTTSKTNVRLSRSRFYGWRMGVLSGSFMSGFVLCVNIGLAVYGSTTEKGYVNGIADLKTGPAAVMSKWSTTFHLFINAFSTMLLAASNYTMQVLCSPTRADIDTAHQQGNWFDVGILSFRNIKRIPYQRLTLALVLAFSSIPLHLFYNAAVFQIATFNEYGISTMEPGTKEWYLLEDDASMNRDHGNGTYIKFNGSSWRDVYDTKYVAEHEHLIFVIDRFAFNLSTSWNHVNTTQYFGLSLLQSDQELLRSLTVESADWIRYDRLYPSNVTGAPVSAHIDHAFSRKRTANSRLQLSLIYISVVIACNVVKLTIMIWTLMIDRSAYIVTLGDGIASFLDRPDTITSHTMGVWQPRRRRYFDLMGKDRQVFIALLFCCVLSACIVLPFTGRASTGYAMLRAWGTDSEDVLPFGSGPLLNAWIVNLPQIILSFCYLALNAICTSMASAQEWNTLGKTRKGLRVTRPFGKQRSTYFLQLPYRWAVPLIVTSGMLHWLLSQSFFLVRLVVVDADNKIVDAKSKTACGYARLSLLVFFAVALVLIVAIASVGLRHLQEAIPAAASCSLIISAACHPERTGWVIRDAQLKKVKWGVLSGKDRHDRAFCSITAGSLKKPKVGAKKRNAPVISGQTHGDPSFANNDSSIPANDTRESIGDHHNSTCEDTVQRYDHGGFAPVPELGFQDNLQGSDETCPPCSGKVATKSKRPVRPSLFPTLFPKTAQFLRQRQKYLVQSLRGTRFHGWRMGVLFGCCMSTLVLLCNIALVVVGFKRGTGYDDHWIATLLNGNEQKISRYNTVLHLFINMLSSILLASSNYTMQVLSAPTRKEIDRAHQHGYDLEPNSRKLTQVEEEVIVQYILNLDQRGFAPTYAAVRDMADKLLAARGAGQVGQKWPANFVRRTDSLKTQFNRAYDRQRALCEDPVLIRSWFELVEQTKAKYSICDEDVYNFDKAGFIMGKIMSQLVVTGSERRGRPKAVQPGNREWVTVIQGINAAGWAIPPFIIFAGQHHLSAWYEEDIPRDWAIAVSDNGWTTNELGVEWLKHFIKHTEGKITSLKRANKAATKRRHHKKKRIQRQGTLTKGEGEDILAQREADQQRESEQRQGRGRSGLSCQALARCKRCVSLVGWLTRLPGSLAYPTRYKIFALDVHSKEYDQMNKSGRYSSLQNGAWRDIYKSQYVSGYGDIYLGIDQILLNANATAPRTIAEYLPWDAEIGFNNFSLLVLPNSDWILYNAGNFSNGTDSPNAPEAMHVDTTLAYQTGSLSRIQISFPYMMVVIAFNVLKICIMAGALIGIRSDRMVTLGDAVASFLEFPDPITKGSFPQNVDDKSKSNCMIKVRTPRVVSSDERGISFYTQTTTFARNVPYSDLVQDDKTVLLFLSMASLLLLLTVFGTSSDSGLTGSNAWLWATASEAALVIGNSGGTGIFNAWLANFPQVLLSLCYVNLNTLCTAMAGAAEWNKLGDPTERKSLRVTAPKGLQRGTYFLQLPYRWALPLISVSWILHWLLSQSFFLVRIDQYDRDGVVMKDSSTSACGVSLSSLTTFVAFGLVLYIVVRFVGEIGMVPRLPPAGSSSLMISAACHPPPSEDEPHQKEVSWGLITQTHPPFTRYYSLSGNAATEQSYGPKSVRMRGPQRVVPKGGQSIASGAIFNPGVSIGS